MLRPGRAKVVQEVKAPVADPKDPRYLKGGGILAQIIIMVIPHIESLLSSI